MLVLAVPILVTIAAILAYYAGAQSNEVNRRTAQLNDSAAEILGELMADPANNLDDFTVLSITHQQRVTAWLKEHKTHSRKGK